MTLPEPSTLDRVRVVAAAPLLALAGMLAGAYVLTVQLAEWVGGLAPVPVGRAT